MQAIILAAGCGNRLKPITDKIPKCLVEVNGVPLLVNTLQQLSNFDINEVIIVVGYKKDMVINKIGHTFQHIKITYVENNLYNKTNNVYSLYLAKNYIHDDTILLECDLFYRKNIIDAILSGNEDCNILVSPFEHDTMEGTVIKVGNDNIAKSLIIKRDQGLNFDYSDVMKTVNIYKLKSNFITNKFLPSIELYIKTESVESYYELVLGSIIYFGNSHIKVIPINASEWIEIDDINDLKLAEEKCKEWII